MMNKSAGRPRSQTLDNSIIKAAIKLFYHKTYPEVSMELIAQQAGVSKATLYRRWPNKSVLAIEVLTRAALAQSQEFGDVSYKTHLISNLKALRDLLASPYAGMIVALMAEAQNKKELHELFYQQFIKPVQAIGDRDLLEAIKRGEITRDIDSNLLFDQLFGLFYYRMLIVNIRLEDSEIETIVEAFFKVAGQ